MIQRPKWEHLTLPSVESVEIFKDPPKSLTTRKKERVNVGDVTYMIRENPDRTSDHINYYAKGVNPMVSVSYANYQASNGVNPRNPYATVPGGMQHRMPILRLEDRMPLSRLKYDNTFIPPSIKAPTPVIQSNSKMIDKQTVKGTIRPSAHYNVGTFDGSYVGNKILDPVHYSVSSSVSSNESQSPQMIDRTQLDHKLKDYSCVSVLAPPTSPNEYVQEFFPEFFPKKTSPITSVTTNLVIQENMQPEVLQPILDGRPGAVFAYSTPIRMNIIQGLEGECSLKQSMDRGGCKDGYYSKSCELDKTPVYSSPLQLQNRYNDVRKAASKIFETRYQ